jgi:hypothetical protein
MYLLSKKIGDDKMLENNIKYILQSGYTIYTKCFIDDEWIPNIIKSTSDNILVINLNDYYFRKGVMVGDFISVRFSYEENEYVIEGEITDIDIYDTYTISIFINNINIYKNRRKHFRFYSKLGASLKTSPSEKGVYSIVINISMSGCAIISKSNINVGSDVTVDLFLSSKNVTSITGTVIRKRALNYGYEYGIAISHLSSDSQSKLKQLVEKLEKDLSIM